MCKIIKLGKKLRNYGDSPRKLHWKVYWRNCCIFRDKTALPYDDNRVELKEPIEEDVDYINASWINGQIAAQGPMQHTTPHFLQMLIEQKIQMVIMLTKTEEALKDGKCCAIHHCIFLFTWLYYRHSGCQVWPVLAEESGFRSNFRLCGSAQRWWGGFCPGTSDIEVPEPQK